MDHLLWAEILLLIGYALMCLLDLLLIVYLRVNRREAFKGDPHASRKVILPAFEPLLWLLAGVTGIYVVFFSVALQIDLYRVEFPPLDREFFYCGRMFVFTFVLVFLCQKSVSLPALRGSVIKALLLSCNTLPVVALFIIYAPQRVMLIFYIKLVTRPLMLLFVVYVCMARPPAGRANACVLRKHGWFIIMYHVILVFYSVFQQFKPDSIWYPVSGYIILCWSAMCPLMIWKILRADTEYWRGMGKRVFSLQNVAHHSLPRPHLQTVHEGISSHGIHILIETHRDYLIDFAHLELKKKVRADSDVAMFSGLLRSKQDVAVKVYTLQHFNEEVVGEFSHEAALCAALRHPNIVEFFGLCVCPPTVCLVSELCQYTLKDVLAARGTVHERRHISWFGHKNEDDHDSVDLQRMQLNIAFMLDCSRAVAYVHSFSPPVLHRDLKPASFLLDQDYTVKLSDFSDSRRLPSEVSVSTASLNSGASTLQPKMTVTGTVEYMAPEMIDSRTGIAAYAEAADVYSLAITFWDILYPHREKYPDTSNNHFLIFESVLKGSRPPIEDDEPINEDVPSRLLELITSAWRSDPRTRPTAQQVVKELENIQETLLATLAQDILSENGGVVETSANMFTGEYAVERMEQLQVIESRSEGIRLGRALMDAGFLHHFEHSCGFQDSNTSYYFLDDDNINFCQPLAILEESVRDSDYAPRSPQSSQLQSPTTKLRMRSRLLSHLTSTFSRSVSDADSRFQGGQCSCRLRGQLQEIPLTPSSGRHRRRRQRQLRNSSSNYSNGSISVMATTPQRWQRRRKNESEHSLHSKLLDEDQDLCIIDIVCDGTDL
ncbi:protein kinase [Phytophthora infestans T30-4]|uniref:Protein kinase n=2 Tax=Phytophthora infestans TaxID=4787 RepID=D0N7M2_PHYIT|nr:protein kinase [Phytophthora infestans T30-4]EEY53571.1 protein kinase [Phytophthora infestans T30-4]KAF4038031.1 DEP domain-containing protein [Phytophthora infestans]KAF4140728.1 DEP domain-containing protein [Phytophthora infestans]|eukprot:XP_002905189.1 protein kinase [Phytophthora infestans T30-4]